MSASPANDIICAASDRWPATLAFIEDPDGYQVELVQRDEVPAEGDRAGTSRDQSIAG